MSIRILQGDCRDVLRTLAAESVDCVVTSPPYWGLRDYGVAGQLGLEPTLGEHIAVMVDVFREVRRVLKKTGTVWLNYGDCYATNPNGRSAADTKAAGNDDRTFRDKPFSTIQGLLKPKDLCMVPQRLAIALQEDGWWIRSQLPWVKRNAMPESVIDRPASAIEYVFLLTRAEKYFYDAEAVRRRAALSSEARWAQDIEAQVGSTRAHAGGKTNGPMKAVGGPRRSDKQRGVGKRQYTGFNDRWDEMERADQTANGRNFRNADLFFDSLEEPWGLISNQNGLAIALDVPPQSFREAHFATFPPGLIEPLIKAGTSEIGCCAKCGAPWVRMVSKEFVPQQDVSLEKGIRGAGQQKPLNANDGRQGFPRGTTQTTTAGFKPTCKHNAAPVPCIVLDPFGGAGTTGMVADRLQRNAILIELNPEYADMARHRLTVDAGFFNTGVEIEAVA